MIDTPVKTLSVSANNRDQQALPMRPAGLPSCPARGWRRGHPLERPALAGRCPSDLTMRSHYTERYGAGILDGHDGSGLGA